MDMMGRCQQNCKSAVYRTVAMLLVMLLTLSGCGRAGRDAIADDMDGVNSEDALSSGSDAKQAGIQETAEELPEKISYVVVGADSKDIVNVDAEVISTGYGKLKVYREKRIEVDDAYLKALADALFDDGKYEVVKPYWMCTREELSREQEYLDSLYQFYNEQGVYFPEWLVKCVELVEYYGTYYNGGAVGDLSEGQLIYRTTLMQQGGETAAYESCILRGMVGEEEYQIFYTSLTSEDGEVAEVRFEIRKLYMEHQAYYLEPSDDNKITYVYGENVCDREQGERFARDMAEKLGFYDMEIASVYHRLWGGHDGYEGLDGYKIFMVRNTDGIQNIFDCFGSAGVADEAGEFMFAGQEYLAFEVDAGGVISVCIGDRYELGECLAEDAAMLSFAQIDELGHEFMNDVYGTLLSTDVNGVDVETVKFGYVTLNYGEDYALVPVWTYYMSGAWGRSVIAWFAVNALDGDIIVFDRADSRDMFIDGVFDWDRDK